MKFGVYIRAGTTYSGMLELAQQAEKLDYFGVFLNDHVHGFANEGKEPYLEAWTTMTGIGVQTKKIRLGHIVLFNSLRNPAFLAKSIATLDQLTNGRYELLIGAGWNKPEYEGYDLMEKGRGMPSAKERVDRFEETLQILRGMLHSEAFSYEGKYWKLNNAINIPQPIQHPFRISVGAEKPRMIKITAKYADGLNIGGNLKSLREKIELLEPELEKNNKQLKDFFISGFSAIHIAKNNEEYDLIIKDLATKVKKPKELKPYGFIGTPEILIDKFRQATDLGVKMIVSAIKPANNVSEMKDKLILFKDEVISVL
ncbi:MAG: LLM class flavin-dependent oxidoreductase [Candidatus Thorarchaeota archaeon]